jgi:hypothetical protein
LKLEFAARFPAVTSESDRRAIVAGWICQFRAFWANTASYYLLIFAGLGIDAIPRLTNGLSDKRFVR